MRSTAIVVVTLTCQLGCRSECVATTTRAATSAVPSGSIAPVPSPSATPTDPFQVDLDGTGVVRVMDRSRGRQIDLRRDIVGCLGEVYDPSTGERFGTGDEKTLLDVTEDHGEHFVVLSAGAAANCDIQGECGGAAWNMTLIWLEIGADLSLVSKQVFVVEDCWESRGLDGEPAEDDWVEWRKSFLSRSHGTFTMRFSEYTGGADVPGRVTYDRRNARAGLQIAR